MVFLGAVIRGARLAFLHRSGAAPRAFETLRIALSATKCDKLSFLSACGGLKRGQSCVKCPIRSTEIR